MKNSPEFNADLSSIEQHAAMIAALGQQEVVSHHSNNRLSHLGHGLLQTAHLITENISDIPVLIHDMRLKRARDDWHHGAITYRQFRLLRDNGYGPELLTNMRDNWSQF
ncbi:MAG: hypothetical protein NVSMB37_0070 [Candidatus Saccharimonadales bacterium]